jgi:hypothetical protein
MPPLSVWFVRSALLHLLLGFTFGALMLGNKGVPFNPSLWRLRPAHIEILLVGWIIQLAMGIAFWILPRFWEPPRRGDVRGAVVAFILLNSGVWLVALSAILALPGQLIFWGRLAEVGAALAFVVHIWPRIVSRQG